MQQNPTGRRDCRSRVLHSLWISLGDFIANISATDSAGNGCQCLAVAATYLIAQQSSDHRADADADRAIVCNRCWCGCWLLVRRCLGILLDGLRLCLCLRMLDRIVAVMHDRFLLCVFMADRWRSGELLRGCRYRCGIRLPVFGRAARGCQLLRG